MLIDPRKIHARCAAPAMCGCVTQYKPLLRSTTMNIPIDVEMEVKKQIRLGESARPGSRLF